jgi:hypothetical protein
MVFHVPDEQRKWGLGSEFLSWKHSHGCPIAQYVLEYANWCCLGWTEEVNTRLALKSSSKTRAFSKPDAFVRQFWVLHLKKPDFSCQKIYWGKCVCAVERRMIDQRRPNNCSDAASSKREASEKVKNLHERIYTAFSSIFIIRFPPRRYCHLSPRQRQNIKNINHS